MSYSQFPAVGTTVAPRDLTLQRTVTAGSTISIPAGINFVYAILVGGGGGGGWDQYSGGRSAGGGGAGGEGGRPLPRC